MQESRLLNRWLASIMNRRGGALAMVAVCMVALLGFMALAVDLAMAHTARGEAQRVADAAALAGASAFIDYQLNTEAVSPAKQRAKDYAARNNVRNETVDTMTLKGTEMVDASEEVVVQVMPDSMKVRVWVRRSGISTFFARLLGVNTLAVQAMAAAEAGPGGSATCVWPFSGPDLWDDLDDDDGDHIPEAGEDWNWDGEDVDYYEPWDGADGGTGYGSPFRNGQSDDAGQVYQNDYGRPMTIKTTSEGQSTEESGGMDTNLGPGNYMLWAMPDSAVDCRDSATGADFLYENMVGCNTCKVQLNGTYDTDTEPGQKWGKVREGLDDVISQDPAARWDPNLGLNGGFTGSRFPLGTSPRMVPIALAHPEQHPAANGRDEIVFNNFALVFIEGYDSNKVVYARFMGFVPGSDGESAGSLVRYLRLVE